MPHHAKRKAHRHTTPLGARKLSPRGIRPRDLPAASLSCKKEVDYIARYLASELRRAERAAFEHHLEICPDCTAFLKTYKATVELTRSFLKRSEDERPTRPPFPGAPRRRTAQR